MTTLQDLIDLAKRRNLSPTDCVLVLSEECGNGDIMYHYLYNTKVVSNVEVYAHNDDIDKVKKAIKMEFMPF